MAGIITIILIIIGLLTGAGARPVDPPDCAIAGNTDGCRPALTEWRSVSIEGIKGVVVPENEAVDVTSPFFDDGSVTEGWTVTDYEIRQLEAGLDEEAASVNFRGSSAPESLAGYYRQYAGIVEDGDHKIFVNGFCSIDFLDDWESQFVFVLDGGTCYFQALYNVDMQEFESFSFNGNA